jgi:hypothetical protein
MKIVKFEDVQRLELISIKLEKIPKEKWNIIIEDLAWLTEKLREAYKLLEK